MILIFLNLILVDRCKKAYNYLYMLELGFSGFRLGTPISTARREVEKGGL